MMRWHWALAAGSLLATACASSVTAPDGVRIINATVRFIDVEGGCWALETSTAARRYEPVTLPATFRLDGLPVRAAIRPRENMGSFCMVGEIVEIISIAVR